VPCALQEVEAVMGAQITILILMVLSLIVGLAKDGQPRENWSFDSVLASELILGIILWWGGFWEPLFK